MNEEMRRVGTLFRQRRTELSLSLKEVENATSIRAGILEAIEEGKVGEAVSGIYAIGFIKGYAGFLGMDAEVLMHQYPQAFRLPSSKQEFAFGIGTLETRGNASGGVKWLPSLLWGGLGVGILLLAWFVARALALV
jgi:cytoskeletal protein RodZ